MTKEQSIKYQAVLFGDFAHIQPTEEIIKVCIGSFFSLGLLPTGSTQELNLQTQKMESRLGLQSMRNGVSVNFLRNRIDIQALPMPGSAGSTLTFPDFIKQAQDISEIIFNVFKPKVNRAGIVHEKFSEPLNAEKLAILRKKFITSSADTFPESDIVEWTVRSCSRFTFTGRVQQPVNVIHAINRVNVQVQDHTGLNDFETIHVALDINTTPTQDIESSSEAVRDFIEQAFAKEQELMKKIDEAIYG
ncbi:hypothetical protein V0R39_10495 [Pseudomonas inefficax]|nr:hypothetical protein [Pseudomonas inefficax]MEE1907454.1 hypothetical protein [Pseudomonas inefficax]MEE1984918.1 hypothetical protein [Pseudomonas inefficax]